MRRTTISIAVSVVTLLAGGVAACEAQDSAAPVAVAGPLTMTEGFYVDPASNPAAWAGKNARDPRAARIRSGIAQVPMARWFGDWTGNVGPVVDAHVRAAANAGELPVLVAYNLPGRDACGKHSAGGAKTAAAYREWISAFAGAVGPHPAVVILEPDALGDYQCMTPDAVAARRELLSFATRQFRDRAPNAWTYLDGGNATWLSPDVTAQRLDEAGLRDVRGFAVNVSNYFITGESAGYAARVNASLAARGYTKPFVVDTSRNGNGDNGAWCNPAGRRVGTPTRAGGGAEMLIWVKVPGESDGPCGIAPEVPAGTFDPDLAISLLGG